jgi:hypothetical protein
MIHITDIEECYTEAEFLEIILNAQKTGFYAGFAQGAKNRNVASIEQVDFLFYECMSELMQESSEYIDFEELDLDSSAGT